MSSLRKYRAWDTQNCQMLYTGVCDEQNGSWGYSATSLHIAFDGSVHGQISDDGGKNGLHEHEAGLVEGRFILMQSTGLKDKNGVDLDWYAGDIIQKGEIIRAITVDWEHGMRFMLGKHILCKQDGINGIKIGDIHANPELLEGK